MDRDRVINSGSNPHLLQLLDDLISILSLSDSNSILMPSMYTSFFRTWCGYRFNSRIKILGIPSSLLEKFGKSLELCQSNRCLQIGEPEVIPQHLMVIAPFHSMVSDHPALIGNHIIVSRDHSPFSGHEIFGGVEAERTRPKTARVAAIV